MDKRDNTIFLFWESNGHCSTDKRVLIGVCNGSSLEGQIENISCENGFTDKQYQDLLDINFFAGDLERGFAWWIDSDNNDTSLYIARYPAGATFDMAGVI